MSKGRKEGSTSVGKQEKWWTTFTILLSKYRNLIFATITLFVCVFSYVMYAEVNKSFIEDFTSSTPEQLKKVLFGEDSSSKPYIFQCAKRDSSAPAAKGPASDKSKNSKDSVISNSTSRGTYTVSPLFEELFKTRQSQYNFAKLNCYQILPSGKSIYDRFGLDKKSVPVIFGNSPWLHKPLQAKASALSSGMNLATFFDKNVGTPRATSISSDDKLHKLCKFTPKKSSNSSSLPSSEDSQSDSNKDDKTNASCIVLMQGTQHIESHSEAEESLIRKYPKLRFAVVDATKYRLSFERPLENPATSFGYKLIVLRNGTHFKTMGETPFLFENADRFIADHLSLPLNDFHVDNSNTSTSRVKLINANSPFFKRAKKSDSGDSSGDDDGDDEDASDDDKTNIKQNKKSSSSTPKQRKTRKSSSTTSDSTKKQAAADNSKAQDSPPPPEPVVLTDVEVAKRQREREQRARDRLVGREDIIFDEEEEGEGDAEGDDEEEGGGGDAPGRNEERNSGESNNGRSSSDVSHTGIPKAHQDSSDSDDEDFIEL